ncbi:toll/interleukin-1 receptor domain-containing protein [Cellvibrio fibrivorans]|uniref:TIR domain-containing protein n=1 Tax=Cellvibrio fibrivorans TaxID=126350 RepID=A0ABU1UX84_9GAMM|nr:toll/interleukin-1 receptor domain-containing protein [Cellvibrio fibrivorans]MDR7089805.1 hypothetical protein [Cellvibrio fibrivorans]
MSGVNRAKPTLQLESANYNLNKSLSSGYEKPCIFLSHIYVDKKDAEQLADYIMEKADIDVYLDIYDQDLQNAVTLKDPSKITALIERGITNSTHAMCLISEKTINSWWVPYELGYAKKAGKKICSLKLKGNVELPDFLKIGDLIYGTKSLNEYIQKIITEARLVKGVPNINVSLESHSSANHSLDSVLDWNN